VLLGGILTALDWHWIFLVNIPIGVAVTVLCLILLPASTGQDRGGRLDVAGSVTITAALLIAVYAIMDGNHAGWGSTQTVGLLLVAAALLGIFLRIETRAESPLVPLGLFRLRSVTTANLVGVLWAAAMFGWFFLSALYLQRVFGYGPLGVGLAFLPGNLIIGAFSFCLSERIVLRWGIRSPLITGMVLLAAGLVLFARAPVGGTYAFDVLPATILLGLGVAVALNPVLLAATSEVAPNEAGLASGVVNTSFMMGGALGLAALASIADARVKGLTAGGIDRLHALTGGYHAAFLAAAGFAAVAAALSAVLLQQSEEAEPSPDSWDELTRLPPSTDGLADRSASLGVPALRPDRPTDNPSLPKPASPCMRVVPDPTPDSGVSYQRYGA
jgi:predicted MFS family arabinose efflux permease